jgi:hypothetical protein
MKLKQWEKEIQVHGDKRPEAKARATCHRLTELGSQPGRYGVTECEEFVFRAIKLDTAQNKSTVTRTMPHVELELGHWS